MDQPCRQRIFDDPIVAEVRNTGDEIAREAGYDIRLLCEGLREAERLYRARLADTQPCATADER